MGSLENKTAVCVRTLVLCGFRITSANRTANQIEIRCERRDVLGAAVKYLIALTDLSAPATVELEGVAAEAKAEGRTLVGVAASTGPQWLGWEEFLAALGGPVPSWRALTENYPDVLHTSSKNEPVNGTEAQAWSVFEQAAADGLEFAMASRAYRHGGLARGRRVSDILIETPDERVLVIDAKASGGVYEVSTETTRQLADYVSQAKVHQKGSSSVGGAVVVAREFAQNESRLTEIGNAFLGESQVPLCFLSVDTLLGIIASCRDHPQLRRSIRWASVFCRCGLLMLRTFEHELNEAKSRRIARG